MRARLLPVNEGALDRVLRVIIGLVLLAAVFLGPRTPLGWLGIVPLITGLAARCPAYNCFGMRTCPTRPSGQARD
jgi:hypothetical protein